MGPERVPSRFLYCSPGPRRTELTALKESPAAIVAHTGNSGTFRKGAVLVFRVFKRVHNPNQIHNPGPTPELQPPENTWDCWFRNQPPIG